MFKDPRFEQDEYAADVASSADNRHTLYPSLFMRYRLFMAFVPVRSFQLQDDHVIRVLFRLNRKDVQVFTRM